MKSPPSQTGTEEPSVKAKAARKGGDPYLSLSGYPWQEWLVTMTDGTVRRTHVPASGGGSGPRAARRDAEEGPYRDLSQPTYKESTARAVREGRRGLPNHVVAEYCGDSHRYGTSTGERGRQVSPPPSPLAFPDKVRPASPGSSVDSLADPAGSEIRPARTSRRRSRPEPRKARGRQG